MVKLSFKKFVVAGILITSLIIAGLYFRSLPKLGGNEVSLDIPPSSAVQLPWPAYGQAAIGTAEHGLLAANGPDKQVPIASITKLLTAMAVLKQKPLNVGEQGPAITISDVDAADFKKYLALGGSVVPLKSGQLISQYQALQALLIPSANNVADSLARWAFGSVNAYVTYANQMLRNMGLKYTKVADASGFSPGSSSSARDLVVLAKMALEEPIIASLVNQAQSDIPGIGVVKSTNVLLGNDGVIGIKTGNTNEAGGCFLLAAVRTVAGQQVITVVSVLGAPNLLTAVNDAKKLLLASDGGFENVNIVAKGQVVGNYFAPWGESSKAIATSNISLLAWKGSNVKPELSLRPLKIPVDGGAMVGSIRASFGQTNKTVAVVLEQSISKPPFKWRLFR